MAEFPTHKEMAKIVAEAALDGFEYQGKTIREWMKIIAEQERKSGKWIPVSERLPKDGERLIDDDVLVSCEDGEVRIGFCMGEDEMGNREWAVSGKVFSEPVAWMPLPPSYQGE